MGVLDPIVRPDEYFAREFPRGSLGKAAGVVVGLGILLAVAVFAFVQTLVSSAFGGVGAGAVLAEVAPVLVVAVPLGMLIGWVIFSGILHVGSAIAGGRGSFKDTMVVVGWATIPSAIAGLVGIGFLYFSLSGAAATSPEQLQRQLQTIGAAGAGNVLISIPFLAWQVYVWGYGLKHARNLPESSAFGVAIVAGALSLLLQLAG